MLLARPIPWEDEEPSGILMRAATLNGWGNVTSFLSALGVYDCKIKLSARSLRRCFRNLARYGISMPTADQMMRVRSATGKRLIGENLFVPLSIFRNECGAVCPTCLSERAYIRRLWSVRFYTTCHIHGCFLVDKCARCFSSLTWTRPSVDCCNCGFDLRGSPLVSGNSSRSQIIVEMVGGKDFPLWEKFVSTFEALVESFPDRWSVTHDECKSLIAIQPDEILVPILTKEVKEIAHIEHPRMTLLPFLRKQGRLRGIGLNVLKGLHDFQIPSQSAREIAGMLSSVETGIVLGITKHHLLCQIGEKHLSCRSMKTTGNVTRHYSRTSVDALLRKLWRPSTDDTALARRQALREPLDLMIDTIVSGQEASAGYDLAIGLAGLRRLSSAVIPEMPLARGKIMDFEESGNFLHVHSTIVRSLVKTGYLTQMKFGDGTRAMCLSREEVMRFNQKYVFVGALARSIGVHPTKFAEKLFAVGVRPVGGPSIDGLLVYLVEREDITHLDLCSIKDRKGIVSVHMVMPDEMRVRAESSMNESVSRQVVADRLGISLREVASLVYKGILERTGNNSPTSMISKLSFDRFERSFNDQSLTELTQAAKEIGESPTEFRSRWVAAGIVKVVDLGLRQCIAKTDLQRVIDLKERFMTAKEAANLFDTGSFFLPNAEKRGLLRSTRMGQRGELRLYSRIDVGKIRR